MSKKKNKKPRDNYEIYKVIRRDWGDVKPYTRIQEDKRKKKPKYKERDEE